MHIAGDNMYTGATTVMRPDGYQSSAYLALQVQTEQNRAGQGRAFKSINLLSDSALAYLCQQRIRQYIHYFCIIHELLIEPFQQANYISFPIAAAVAPAIRLFHNSREYDIVTYELQSSWWQPLSDYLHAHTADLVTEVEEHETDTALR